MSNNITQAEYYLSINNQKIDVLHFSLKNYTFSSPLIFSLSIDCSLKQVNLVQLGVSAVLRIRKDRCVLKFNGVITQCVTTEGQYSISRKRYTLLLSSAFYLNLQTRVNEVYPEQTVGEFIASFIKKRVLKPISYSIKIKSNDERRQRVANQSSGFEFLKTSLYQEGIYFISTLSSDREALHFTDDLKTLSKRTLRLTHYDVENESAELGQDLRVRQYLNVSTSSLKYWIGDTVQIEDKTYRIDKLSIEGWQDNHAYGTKAHYPLLKCLLCLAPTDAPFELPLPNASVTPFQTATVVSQKQDQPELNERGRYRVRYDFIPQERSSDVLNQIPKNVSFSGKNAGGDMALYPETKVVLCIPEGKPEKPVILGAFDVLESEHHLTYRDAQQNYIQSALGHQLAFLDGETLPRILLSTNQQRSILSMSDEDIRLQSHVGKMQFFSAGLYHMNADERIDIQVAKNSRFLSQGNLSIKCLGEGMHWEIQQALYVYAQDVLTIESQSIYLSAVGAIRCQVEDNASVKGGSLSFSSRHGSVMLSAPHMILTAKRFVWSCGATSLSLEGGILKIVAPSTVVDGVMTALAT